LDWSEAYFCEEINEINEIDHFIGGDRANGKDITFYGWRQLSWQHLVEYWLSSPQP
jgi:hypothetical protein